MQLLVSLSLFPTAKISSNSTSIETRGSEIDLVNSWLNMVDVGVIFMQRDKLRLKFI